MSLPLRRSALPPILLVLVPLSLLQTAWGLSPLAGGDPPRLIDGVLVLPSAGLPETLVVAVAWAWAVTAGVAATVGVERPLRRALRGLPTVCGALTATVVVLLAAVFLVGSALPGDPLVVAIVAALVAVPVVPLLVRLALVLPIAVLEDRRGWAAFHQASTAARARTIGLAVLLLLGVAVPAQLLGWAFGRPEELVSGQLAGLGIWLLRDVALVAVAALQASTLVAAYRTVGRRAPTEDAGPQAAEPGATASRSRRAGRARALLAGAAVLLPTVLAGGVVATERLVEVSVQRQDRLGRLMAIGWPADRPPVLVGQNEIHDCTDDRCSGMRTTKLSVAMFRPNGGAVIASDGSVYALGQQELEHCDPERRCRRAAGRLEELEGSHSEALAVSPDGDILIASATPVGSAEDGGPGRQVPFDLKLLRCPDVSCTHPATVTFGRVDVYAGPAPDRDRYPTVAVGVDRAGRPVLALRAEGGMAWVGRCDTPTCTSTRLDILANPRPTGQPTDEELAHLHFDDVLTCYREDGCGSSDPTATVDRPGGGMYGVAVEWAEASGVRIHVGQPPLPQQRVVLLSCRDHRCNSPSRIPLVDIPRFYRSVDDPVLLANDEKWLLAANPDGRVLVTRAVPDQIVLLRPRS